MKAALLIALISFAASLSAQTNHIINHVDKSGIQVGSNNSMIVNNYPAISNYQTKKYNKIWIDAVQKVIDEKSEKDNKRYDSIGKVLLSILQAVESIPKAMELAKDSLKKYNVKIDEGKFNSLTQEVILLNKDGDFTKYGNEYVFNPLPTIKKGEVAFKSDFISSSLVPIKKNNNYGYINSSGVLKIPYSYDYAAPFRKNMAIVKKNMRWILIDTMNTIVHEVPNADTLFQNNDSLIPYFTQRDDNLYIYKLKDSSTYVYEFSDREYPSFVSPVESSTKKASEVVIVYMPQNSLKKYETLVFFEGSILVRKTPKDSYFVADYHGKMLNNYLDYDAASVSIETGVVSVKKINSWGYYDLRKKEEIISPRYKFAEDFLYDYSIVVTFDNKYGLIDRNNHSYIKMGEWKIERMSNNLLKFKSVISKIDKRDKFFITDASLNCIQGNCKTTE